MILKKGTTFTIDNQCEVGWEFLQTLEYTGDLLAQMGLVPAKNPVLNICLVPHTGLAEGGYRLSVRSAVPEVVIAGSGPEGIRCGLFAFLEYLGVRWFTPQEDPILPGAVELTDLEVAAEPSFPYRGLHICAGAHHFDRTVGEWMSHLKMNRKLTHHGEVGLIGEELASLGLRPDTCAHSYSYWIPDHDHEAHPDWFALVGGKRIRQKEGGQLCLANAEMREEFTAHILRYHAEHPEVSIVGICANDGYGWCECDECLALDTEKDRAEGTVNGRMADFVQDICERVRTERPEIMLGNYSYSNHADFHLVRPEPLPENLTLSCTLFRCLRHRISDPTCPRNAPLFARVKELRSKVRHMYLYEYYMHNWHDLPAPMWRVVADDMRVYRNLGLDGWMSEVVGADRSSYRTAHLPLYVAAKCLYDVSTDVDDLLRDYCAKRFGPAAGPMEQYLRTLEAGLETMPGCFTHAPSDLEAMLTPLVREQAGRHLEEAVALAQDGPFSPAVAAEQRLFTRWCRFITDRPKYRYQAPVVPMPIDVVNADEFPAAGGLVLVDKVYLVPPEKNRTHVAVAADRDRLGFLIDCHEVAMNKITVREGNSSGEVYGSDNIEIFLAPHRRSPVCYHLLISAGGYHCGCECRGNRWNWAWEYECQTEVEWLADRWRVRFVMPKSAIGAEEGWAFSLVRNRHVKGWDMYGLPDGGVFFNPSLYLEVEPA